MRQHKLALCSDHYQNWVLGQTQRFIQKYHMFAPEERILVAVSGGKDSLALWDVLTRLNYRADGLYIDLGIDENLAYSEQSKVKAEAFAQEYQLQLITFEVGQVEGATIPEAASYTHRGMTKACSLCGLTKRHIMNRVGRDRGYDVLATGHNLDDEAAALFGNVLQWQVGFLSRQWPVLEGSPEGFIRRVKPFCRLYERETAAYAFLRGIDYIYDECPFSVNAKSIYYKEILNHMESENPGAKQQFYLSFLKAKQEGFLSRDSGEEKEALHACPTCGQPTSAPGQCSYCRTWEKVRSRKSA
jgi:uncharacterized protein (TIGR00269 family)